MFVRRILLSSLSLSKAFHFPRRDFSEFKFPLGREPSSLPWALTEKLNPNSIPSFDDRPISLRFRVSSMIELCQLDKAAEMARLAVTAKHDDSLYRVELICNEIIGAMCAAKRYDDAIALFHYFFNKSHCFSPDGESFNLIMKAHCDEDNVDDAFELYHYAKSLGAAGVDTHRVLVKGFVDAGRVFEALGFVKREKIWDPEVYSYLVRGFLELGEDNKADEVFHRLDQQMIMFGRYSDDEYKRRSTVVEATLVDYWFKQGQEDKATEIYRHIKGGENELRVYPKTGNTLLEILCENGKTTEAWELFYKMITNSRTFDRESFKIMVNVCFELGEFDKAVDTFKRPELRRSSRCYGNIISRFCELGMMSEAQGLFEADEYLRPDVPTFRSMINGYAKAGRVEDATNMLRKMVDATLRKVAVYEAE